MALIAFVPWASQAFCMSSDVSLATLAWSVDWGVDLEEFVVDWGVDLEELVVDLEDHVL